MTPPGSAFAAGIEAAALASIGFTGGITGRCMAAWCQPGIGQALATALVSRGDTVVLADVNADGAKQVAAGLGSRASAVGLDVRNADRKGGQWTAPTAAQRQLADRRSRRSWPGDATSLGWPGDAASWAARCRSRRRPSASWPPWACESLVRLCSSRPLRVSLPRRGLHGDDTAPPPRWSPRRYGESRPRESPVVDPSYGGALSAGRRVRPPGRPPAARARWRSVRPRPRTPGTGRGSRAVARPTTPA